MVRSIFDGLHVGPRCGPRSYRIYRPEFIARRRPDHGVAPLRGPVGTRTIFWGLPAREGGTDILSGAIRHVFVRATELAAQNIRVGGFGALGKRVLRRPVEGDERLLSATLGAGSVGGGGGSSSWASPGPSSDRRSGPARRGGG